MSRASRLAAAFTLALTAYAFEAVHLPARVVACMCVEQPETLAAIRDLDQVSIVAGTIGPQLEDRTPVGVDAWFHGPVPANVVWLRGGTTAFSSCDIEIAAGQRRLLVLYGGPRAPGANGLYSTGLCTPGGVIGNPDGDALLEEASAMFGSAQPPPSPVPEAPVPFDLAPLLGQGMLWAAAAFGIGLALLGTAVLFARRRPTR